MWPPSILLKCPVVAKHVVSEFESHRQHFVYLLLMIDGFFPENHQKRYSFGTYSKPNQNFLKKFLYFLDTIFYIDFGRTWYPTSLVLRIVSSIEVEQFFVGKEKPQCPLCKSSFISNSQISIFLLYGLQKVLAVLCSCTIKVLDHL